MKTINLAEVRVISGTVPRSGKFSIQMHSTNLSANTTFNLQLSIDGENWDNAQESGTDITDTLVDDVPMLKSFECGASLKMRIVFAGATTGTVNYVTLAG